MSLQLSSEQSSGDVGITQLDLKRVPQERSRGCKCRPLSENYNNNFNRTVCLVRTSRWCRMQEYWPEQPRKSSPGVNDKCRLSFTTVILPEIYMAISIRRLPSSTSTTAIYCCYLLQINAAQRWTWLRSIHGLGWVDFFGNCRGLGGVGFNDIVMGWVQRLRQMRTACKTLNFIPRTLNSWKKFDQNY